ncbi:MAG: iron ABC transporter permease, partial [Rhodobacteraceae bacterium]
MRVRAEAVIAAPPTGRLRRAAPFAALGLALVAALILGVAAGATPIPADDVWRIALHRLLPGLIEPDWTTARERIVWELRVPRALLGALAGAALAMGGAALQATTRNPLADPFLLGVSAGAALGAVAVIA